MRKKLAVKVGSRLLVMNCLCVQKRYVVLQIQYWLVAVIVFPSCPIYPGTLSSSLADIAPAALLPHPLIPSAIQISSSNVIIYTECNGRRVLSAQTFVFSG
jgi:hypothetical protein